MQNERNVVTDNRIKSGGNNKNNDKPIPEWLRRLKSIKHIEIIVAVIVILVLIVAYTYGVTDSESNVNVSEGQDTLAGELQKILSSIKGVGDAEVLIVYNGGKQLEIASKTDRHTNTVNDGDRVTSVVTETVSPIIVGGNQPLVIGEKRAQIDGVIIVADGGGDNMIKVSLMQAISALLNVKYDKVQVFEKE